MVLRAVTATLLYTETGCYYYYVVEMYLHNAGFHMTYTVSVSHWSKF